MYKRAYLFIDYLSPDALSVTKDFKYVLTHCIDYQNNCTCEMFSMWLKTKAMTIMAPIL